MSRRRRESKTPDSIDVSSDPSEELEASDFELEAVFQIEIFGLRSEDDEALEEPVESEYGVIAGE